MSLLESLRGGLIVSVQAWRGSALDDPHVIAAMARAAQESGAVGGAHCRRRTTCTRCARGSTVPIIGLIKREYAGFEPYITPTLEEVRAVVACGAEIVAFDATRRRRPGGVEVSDVIDAIHAAGRLAMADCATPADALAARSAGADAVATTLCGYTADTKGVPLPALDLVRELGGTEAVHDLRGRDSFAAAGARGARCRSRRGRGRNRDYQCRLAGPGVCRVLRQSLLRARLVDARYAAGFYSRSGERASLVENTAQPVRLGRGFWTATTILGILAVGSIVFWYTFPLEQYLPAAIVTARQVDTLFRFMAATGSALYIFVGGYLLYFSIAFRAKATDSPDAIGVQIHDNHKLEFWWTLIPALFVVLLSVVSVRIWYEIMLEPENGVVVEAIGHQFYFSFRYPQINGEVTDEMHLPRSVPVTLNLTSADVIHGFWVPAMRLKNDTVPGLVTTIRFTPRLDGRYPIICTQFCGVLHSEMDKQVLVIEEKPAFDKWYKSWQAKNAHASNAPPAAGGQAVSLQGGNATAGQQMFSQKCSACHMLAPFDQKLVGPGLKGVLHDPAHPNLVNGHPATPQNVANILQNGYTGSMGTMPNATANGLSYQDIANLVAFLDSLK